MDVIHNFVLVRVNPAYRKTPEDEKNNDGKHRCKIHFGPPPAQVDQRLAIALVESHTRVLLAADSDFRRRCLFAFDAPAAGQLRQPDAESPGSNDGKQVRDSTEVKH